MKHGLTTYDSVFGSVFPAFSVQSLGNDGTTGGYLSFFLRLFCSMIPWWEFLT
jgi:hypothetical protein